MYLPFKIIFSGIKSWSNEKKIEQGKTIEKIKFFPS
jgi:hypothetical protein